MIAQYKVEWTGGPSSPGVTVFNMLESGTANYAAAAAAIRAFFNTQDSNYPDEYTLTFPRVFELYSETSGQLSGEAVLATSEVPAPRAGSNTGGYAHGVGVRVDWITGAIVNGRRVVGRTFLVPWGAAAFGADGNVIPTMVSGISIAADQMLADLEAAACPLVVWSRPSTARPVGEAHEVISLNVPTKAAVLRSRRD